MQKISYAKIATLDVSLGLIFCPLRKKKQKVFLMQMYSTNLPYT